LPAPAKQLARLYSGLASDRRRNCTARHRGCNDALLLGSRPSPALPNRSHYLISHQTDVSTLSALLLLFQIFGADAALPDLRSAKLDARTFYLCFEECYVACQTQPKLKTSARTVADEYQRLTELPFS
jgi:hypothetical protein